MTPDKRVEELEHFANIEHERWSRWQAYLHSKCVEHSDGKGEWVCFPAELYKRWERQINTPYAELSEAEKESDREQVRPYLDYLTQYHQDLMIEVVEKRTGWKGYVVVDPQADNYKYSPIFMDRREANLWFSENGDDDLEVIEVDIYPVVKI